MKGKLISPRKAENCKAFLRENVDLFSFAFGESAITGWTKFGWFSLSYRDGEYRRFPLFNRAFGRISRRKGRTIVSYRTYKGLTDPVGLFVLFVAALGLMLAIAFQDNVPMDEAAESAFGLAAAMAGITWLSTVVREEGREGERELVGFIERNFGQLPPDDV